jgi:SAM-dependent methyltransferase
MSTASQSWEPGRYARNARFVAELGLPLLDLLAPRPGERILDLGCGEGTLTQKLVALGCRVVGVDAGPMQVAAARAQGLDARVKDAQSLDFDREFDAVFSNAALHWMRDPDAVIAGVARGLRPGGRFVGEMGGAGNVERIRDALEAALSRRGIDPAPRNPWYFPTAEEYAGRLRTHGFDVDSISLFARPTALPGTMAEWLETFAEPFTNALDPSQRDAFRREVESALRPGLCDAAGRWTADYVRLRFAARLPESSAAAPASLFPESTR